VGQGHPDGQHQAGVAPVYPPGATITRREVPAELPFGNRLVTLDIEGDALKAAIENGLSRYQGKVSRIYFRGDAGFANPEVYEFLEAGRIKHAIRLPANRVLQDRIGFLLARPVGRPPNERLICDEPLMSER
jgi:hypothetical protein